MTDEGRLSILLLADDQKGHPSAIHDHIQAFLRYSRHRVELFNPRGLADSRFLDLDAFDVVVVHYSIVVIWPDYLSSGFRERLAAFAGLKVQFLQDEYRFVDAITAEMRRLGIDLLYSVAPERMWPSLYGERLPDTELLPTLTGYVPEGLVGRPTVPLGKRSIDVGYRGRSLPFWLGRLGFEKIEVGRGFLAQAAGTGLRCDIAWTEGARIHGAAWDRFMGSCRTMLASESGSSLVDYDGSLERLTREYVATRPTADYEEVEHEVLAPFLDQPWMNTVSPRIFEASGSGTAMVMFPGDYAGVVRPWEHYVPLEKDFSNFDEVVERIRDLGYLEDLTKRAREDLIMSGTYSERAFIAGFDSALEQRAQPSGRLRAYPTRRLAFEQLSAGRNYRLSGLYWLARDILLGYLGTKEALRRPALRALLLRSRRSRAGKGRLSLWDDVFRLAMLTAIQVGTLRPASDPFAVDADFDEADGRLTLTSRPAGAPTASSLAPGRLAAAVRTGELREVLWNHAPVGQYVTVALPPLPKRISFDVGRYDAYGVYRFGDLAELVHEAPDLVIEALTPLLLPQPSAAPNA